MFDNLESEIQFLLDKFHILTMYPELVGVNLSKECDLDMFEEIRLAAILAKMAQNDPTALPARQALLMATRQGAEALFLGDVTGSLEAGKFADIIMVDAETLHNTPYFRRNPEAVYAEIVYSGKSTDVAHVMCHGRWLMRDRALLTLDIVEIKRQAQQYAIQVDAFLAAREGNVLSKLLAVGGVERAESFEVQVKAILRDQSILESLLDHPDVEVLRMVHYKQYDTYFVFNDERDEDVRVRYREDDKLDAEANVSEVRTRLTFTTRTKENEFDSAVLLSHSRFIAPADRPLRFYQEYFAGSIQRELYKERMRYRIHYQGVLFYINVDKMIKPALPDTFIEIKSRTWSETDAEIKAARIREMLDILGLTHADTVRMEYLEMITQPE